MRPGIRVSLPRLLPLLASLVFAPAAHAAWPHDPTINVRVNNAVGGNSAYSIATLPDGAGGTFIAWVDYRIGRYQVYATHLLSDGTLAAGWPVTGVAVAPSAGSQQNPKLASDGAGGIFVAFQDDRLNTGTFGIYVQRLSGSGVVAGGYPASGLSAGTPSGVNQETPYLASDGAGGVYVAWTYDYGPPDIDLYMARFGPSGLVAPWTTISNSTQVEQAVGVFPDGAGNAFVAYEYDSLSGTSNGVRLQKVGPSLSLLYASPLQLLGPSSTPITDRRVVLDGTGRLHLLATYGTFNNENLVVFSYDVRGTLPTYIGYQYPVGINPAEFSLYDFAADPAGGSFAIWSRTFLATNLMISGFRADAQDRYGWSVPGLDVIGTETSHSGGYVCTDGSAGAITIWGDGANVFGSRIQADGAIAPGWTGTHTPIATGVGIKSPQDVIPDGKGGAIALWTDSRVLSGTFEIFAQRVDRFGALGDAAPHLVAVKDIPSDQGGAVKLTWTPSYLDSGITRAVDAYWIWREVPTAYAQAAVANGARWADDGSAPVTVTRAGVTPRLFRHASATGLSAYAWEYVTSQPANTFPQYSYVASTLTDSMPGQNRYTRFMVEARAIDGLAFWDSPPDSGYSVDNLPPATPSPFNAHYQSGVTALSWGPNSEADLAGYRLYRGASSSFTPGPSNLIASLTTVSYDDVAPTGSWYKLAAIDAHGNLSGFAMLGPSGITAVDGVALPRELGFTLTSAIPARGPVGLRLALPRATGVRLELYDASGRRVRTLVDGEREAGYADLTWDTRDEAGHAMASGLYFARLTAEGRAFTRRIAIVR